MSQAGLQRLAVRGLRSSAARRSGGIRRASTPRAQCEQVGSEIRVHQRLIRSNRNFIQTRNLISTTTKMSSFSNTDTGSKPADPYTAKNAEEPSLKEKVADLTQFIDKAKFCMLTTKTQDGLLASRCMAVAAKEGNGVDLVYHTNTESGKTDDLDANSEVNVAFLDSAGEWASISGQASVETDRSRVREHYSPALKAWLGDLGDGKHDGGPEDPRIGLIKVKATTISYAVSRKNMITSAIEVAKGVITGEAAAVNKLRHLSTQEIQQWRSSA